MENKIQNDNDQQSPEVVMLANKCGDTLWDAVLG